MGDAKVKAIYEAIDARNYKLSLKLCTTLLNKPKSSATKGGTGGTSVAPQVQLVQVLKALTLERLGKSEEAQQVCNEVRAQQPIDPNLLDTMVLVYKPLGLFAEITSLYETASTKNPKSEILLVGLFNSYVRQGNFQKQNQVATNLYKQFHKEKYLLWAIMSLVLQAEGSTSKLQIELAKKMFEKMISEDKITDLESLSIYFDILQQQKDNDKILATINKFSNLYKLEEERLRFQVETFLKLSQWDAVKSTYKTLLTNYNNDDWVYWKGYLDAGFAIDSKGVDFTVEALAFIKDMQATETDPKKYKRGPFLIEIELLHRTSQGGLASTLLKALVQYYKLFGDRSCCASDIKLFVKDLPAENYEEFYQQLDTTLASFPVNDIREKEMNVLRLVTLSNIKYNIGFYDRLDKEKKILNIRELFKLYEESFHISNGTKEPTELAFGDGLLLLCVNLLQQVGFSERNLQILIEATALLELGLKNSKYNYQMKLIAIILYCQMGAIFPASNIFSSLDVKHILLDTISYFILDDAITLGHSDFAISLCKNAQFFHEENTKTTPDYVIRAYSHGSYSKVKEFIQFKEKLEHSQQLAIFNTELVILELQQNSNSLLEVEAFLRGLDTPLCHSDEKLSQLVANQDYSILSCPILHGDKAAKTSAFTTGRAWEEQLEWLKIRGLVVSILRALVIHKQDEASLLIATLKSSKRRVDRKNSFETQNLQLIICMFDATSHLLKLDSSHEGQDFVDNANNEDLKCMVQFVEESCSIFSTLTTQTIEHFSLSGTKGVFAGVCVSELYTLAIESSTFFKILVDLWLKILPTPKKKQPGVISAEARVAIKKFTTTFKTCLEELLQRCLSAKNDMKWILDEPNYIIQELAKDKTVDLVLENISTSHEKSLASMLKSVELKLNFLKVMKL